MKRQKFCKSKEEKGDPKHTHAILSLEVKGTSGEGSRAISGPRPEFWMYISQNGQMNECLLIHSLCMEILSFVLKAQHEDCLAFFFSLNNMKAGNLSFLFSTEWLLATSTSASGYVALKKHSFPLVHTLPPILIRPDPYLKKPLPSRLNIQLNHTLG